MSANKISRHYQFSLRPIAAAVSTALVAPATAIAQDEDTMPAQLEEVLVTATKFETNLQKVPSSVQAIPEAMLKEIGALNAEDYARFIPNVSWLNFNTGGNNQVIFRGVHTSTGAFTMTRSSSVYLDEIPITSTAGDSPDIRMLDVNRVEALAGPQGTLFGAAAQSGILRLITNKPDTTRFDASADIELFNGNDSAASHKLTAMINIPLVEDVFAIRIAAQSGKDAGYIDNVLGHTPDTWFGETAAESAANAPPAYMYPDPYIWRCEQGQGDCVWGTNRREWGTLRNDDVAENNWNSAEYLTYRISAKWNMNDNWSATASYSAGDTDSQGNNAYNPFVGDLQTIRHVKNSSRSEWDLSSLVIEGDLGFAQFVSATSFYENQRTYIIDNTLYYKYYTTNYCGDQGAVGATSYTWYYWENPVTGRTVYLPLYCVTPAAGSPSGAVGQIPDMAGFGEGPEWQERWSQEFRLSHQGEKFDWLAGLYYEDSNDSWNSVWMADANTPYQDSISYAYLQACLDGSSVNYTCYGSYSANGQDLVPAADRAAALLTADHYWDSRDDTDWKQQAVFGEVIWHLNEKTNVTFGGRFFENTNKKLYIKYLAGHTGPDGRQAGGFIQPIWIGNDIRQTTKQSEFVPKLSVDYSIDDDKMVYALYTEGYRVGGINRANRRADWSRTLWGQEWDPDRLKNYEVGLKSRWADNTVQLNLTAFYMDWKDFQHEVVDPSGGDCVYPEEEPTCRPGTGAGREDGSTNTQTLPWISIVGNVGDAHNAGVTAELDWVPSDQWRVGANAMWLEAELDSVTSDERAGLEPGQQLPNFPKFQGAAWATYSWPVSFAGAGEMFLRGQASYMGETTTKLVPPQFLAANPPFTNSSYTVADLRLGLISSDGDWEINLFVNNVTDERAQVNQDNAAGEWAWGRSGQYEHSHNVYTVRPREYGIRVFARFGGD
jgi:outer membrane receptor protein involved in Fe transport